MYVYVYVPSINLILFAKTFRICHKLWDKYSCKCRALFDMTPKLEDFNDQNKTSL